jgi:hypothetical protein
MFLSLKLILFLSFCVGVKLGFLYQEESTLRVFVCRVVGIFDVRGRKGQRDVQKIL